MEQMLAGVWRDLLNITDLRLDDNFFDLGGHSLLAMQAILAMESRTGKRVSPRHFIFENLRQIARTYDETQVDLPKQGILKRFISGIIGTRSP